jgi:hypothetical protein
MFPVSGAEQFIARFARPYIPRSSAIGEYSRTEMRPTSGRKKLYSPRALLLASLVVVVIVAVVVVVLVLVAAEEEVVARRRRPRRWWR